MVCCKVEVFLVWSSLCTPLSDVLEIADCIIGSIVECKVICLPTSSQVCCPWLLNSCCFLPVAFFLPQVASWTAFSSLLCIPFIVFMAFLLASSTSIPVSFALLKETLSSSISKWVFSVVSLTTEQMNSVRSASSCKLNFLLYQASASPLVCKKTGMRWDHAAYRNATVAEPYQVLMQRKQAASVAESGRFLVLSGVWSALGTARSSMIKDGSI